MSGSTTTADTVQTTTAATPARIRTSYAVNQWKPNFDDFARPSSHLRAFKVVVASGFSGIELRGGTGRWDPLGRPASIEATYGSLAAFKGLLADVGLEAVSSWAVDPGEPVDEELTRGRSVLDTAEHAAILEWARPFAAALAELGGDRLVVRALPTAWQVGEVGQEQVATAAASWDRLGEVAREHGVRVTLHADALSAAADEGVLAALLEATDPALVGLTVDTGELALAGIDPVAVLRRHADRVDHVQLKDVRQVDEAGERLRPHAEHAFLVAGGDREVERWFYEVGTRGGLVDAPAALAALRDASYEGWVVFESEQTPNPASSVMLNGWYAKHRLAL